MHRSRAENRSCLRAHVPLCAGRYSYWPVIEARDRRRLKFVDESGVNLAMTRLYGRAPKGERVVGSVPQNYGPNVTVLAALGP